jgi:hypothetical protein
MSTKRVTSRVEILTQHLQPDGTQAVAVAEQEGRKAKNFERVNPKVVRSSKDPSALSPA